MQKIKSKNIIIMRSLGASMLTTHRLASCVFVCVSMLVKRYVRKGIPNEHRALVWMSTSGAQEQLDRNPGYYQSALGAQHDPKLMDSIRTGETRTSQGHVVTAGTLEYQTFPNLFGP